MHTIELEDVQGYVLREYRNLKYSRFTLLKVTDRVEARKWINGICDQLTNAEKVNIDELPDTALNIAFAKDGLLKMGLSEKNLDTFAPPFKEGMVTEHRRRLLGDVDSSDPREWQWGKPDNFPKVENNGEAYHNQVEIILMVFGKDETTCLNYYKELKEGFASSDSGPVRRGFELSGLEIYREMDGLTLKDNKEHFGFRDGISQPIVRGSGRTGPEFNCVNPGEFILGYENNYFVFPDSPTIVDEQGNTNLLTPSGTRPGFRDLGKNGTFLIIRQMQEHVDRFWGFMNEQTKNEDGSINEEASIKLASQMFGRWPSGAPLTKFPDKDPGGASDDNDFLYHHDDQDGAKCPFGSHARRMNPRDNFEDDPPDKSIILSNRHRLIRRARLYGAKKPSSPMDHTREGEVGLYFTCFAGDISRQFEFLQYTWSNYPKIKQLYSDPDPIIGVVEKPVEARSVGYVSGSEPGQEREKKPEVQQFTIQGKPYNKTVQGLERFIRIRGGAYFFFPSITAIRYLCSIKD